MEWGVEGYSNCKSRLIENRDPINQKGTVDVKKRLFSYLRRLFSLFL